MGADDRHHHVDRRDRERSGRRRDRVVRVRTRFRRHRDRVLVHILAGLTAQAVIRRHSVLRHARHRRRQRRIRRGIVVVRLRLVVRCDRDRHRRDIQHHIITISCRFKHIISSNTFSKSNCSCHRRCISPDIRASCSDRIHSLTILRGCYRAGDTFRKGICPYHIFCIAHCYNHCKTVVALRTSGIGSFDRTTSYLNRNDRSPHRKHCVIRGLLICSYLRNRPSSCAVQMECLV